MIDNFDDELLNELNQKEAKSKFEYDSQQRIEEPDPDVENVTIPDWIPTSDNITPRNLGKVNVNRTPLGMEAEWKNIPVDTLPSKGFGYPDGFEIAIKSAKVT